jgi:hypothetical protein
MCLPEDAGLDWDFETEAKFGAGAAGTPNCDTGSGERERQSLIAVAPPEGEADEREVCGATEVGARLWNHNLCQ